MIIATVTVAGALAIWGRWVNLTRPIERGYAAVTTALWAIDLKRGMELLPWASCIDRIATTPQEAEALLADVVIILDGRADDLTSRGERVREAHDGDLVLGQGMVKAGWHQHKLDAPGKFLIIALTDQSKVNFAVELRFHVVDMCATWPAGVLARRWRLDGLMAPIGGPSPESGPRTQLFPRWRHPMKRGISYVTRGTYPHRLNGDRPARGR